MRSEYLVLVVRGFTKTFTLSQHTHCKFRISRSSVTSLFIWLCIETLNRGGFIRRIETCTFRAYLFPFRSFSESAQPMGLILSPHDGILFKLYVDNDFHIWHIHLSIFAFPQHPQSAPRRLLCAVFFAEGNISKSMLLSARWMAMRRCIRRKKTSLAFKYLFSEFDSILKLLFIDFSFLFIVSSTLALTVSRSVCYAFGIWRNVIVVVAVIVVDYYCFSEFIV